ncbi:hypothetical protein N7520_009740 [Penicillium odoratum]|uniref:uncharacterized protein n=1 Tax=Penicillium odoratum TaxID=1167516 RepID=UPI00254863A8|nr:uncharacterized protein N7520_009740 [Penicillium odoratum]KAJ5752823.1 hypothetical protein N7520_009740 [Penicillium odoratum]
MANMQDSSPLILYIYYREFNSFSHSRKAKANCSINLLEKMIIFDPQGRVSASGALACAFLAPYQDPTDEPEADRRIDWAFDRANYSIDTWKSRLHAEVLDYHKEAEMKETINRWLGDERMECFTVTTQQGLND